MDTDAPKPQASAVRVSTVDNYQGEESKIVIASLTRSNGNGVIGFLKNQQRVNVLLSRARDGLVLVGNAACLIQGSATTKTWPTILKMPGGAGGGLIDVLDGFPARCETHGTQTWLKTAEDFARYAPLGGCAQPCGAALPCGHKCPERTCHAAGVPHGRCTAVVECRCACRQPCASFSAKDEQDVYKPRTRPVCPCSSVR